MEIKVNIEDLADQITRSSGEQLAEEMLENLLQDDDWLKDTLSQGVLKKITITKEELLDRAADNLLDSLLCDSNIDDEIRDKCVEKITDEYNFNVSVTCNKNRRRI